MNNNPINQLQALFQAPAYEQCKNRKGIRRKTGQLLEHHYCRLVAEHNTSVSIEVGAHEATFSQTCQRLNPACDSFAYEANPHVHKIHVDELTRQGVDYQNLAISAVDGVVELSIPTRIRHRTLGVDNRISSIHKRDQPDVDYEVLSVRSNRLDTLFADDNRSKAFWIDVEGAQYEVLSSMGDLWSSTAFIYIEVENRNVWVNDFDITNIDELFAAHGFTGIMRDNLARGQFNAVYASPEMVNHPLTAQRIERHLMAISKLTAES